MIPMVWRTPASVGDSLPPQGFGAAATGGAGGPTFAVTSTANSGPGSLREAVVSANSAGSGIVSIETSGPITLDSSITVGSNITLTGANAPAAFLICGTTEWNGMLLNVTGSNVILEHLRLMRGLGRAGSGQNEKNINLAGGNILVRHCSFAWADDEVFTAFNCKGDVTLQYCMFYEAIRHGHHFEDGFQMHPMVLFIAGSAGGSRYTVAHSILAHGHARMPVFRRAQVEMINCITYHWDSPFPAGGFSKFDSTPILGNIRGCIWLDGPSGQGTSPMTVDSSSQPANTFHVSDCLRRHKGFREELDWDIIKGGKPPCGKDTPLAFSPEVPVPVTVLPRGEVWAHLQPRVGAYLHRSHSDARILDQIGRAITKSALTGELPDTPVGAQTNANPLATRRPIYATFADALTGPSL